MYSLLLSAHHPPPSGTSGISQWASQGGLGNLFTLFPSLFFFNTRICVSFFVILCSSHPEKLRYYGRFQLKQKLKSILGLFFLPTIMEAFISFFCKVLERGTFGQDANISKSITRKRKKYTPKPLPHVRSRSLSITSDKDNNHHFVPIESELDKRSSGTQHICYQHQSGLFSSLPAEIRIKIWTYILVPADLHVVRGEGRLLTLKCLGDVARDWYPPCQHLCWGSASKPFLWYRGVSPGYCIGTRGCEWYTSAVPLLQTCRLMYALLHHIG